MPVIYHHIHMIKNGKKKAFTSEEFQNQADIRQGCRKNIHNTESTTRKNGENIRKMKRSQNKLALEESRSSGNQNTPKHSFF